jgi:hypothetical protein
MPQKKTIEREFIFPVEMWGWKDEILQVKVPFSEIKHGLLDLPTNEGRIRYFNLAHHGRRILWVESADIYNGNEDWDYHDDIVRTHGRWQAEFNPPLPPNTILSQYEPYDSEGKIVNRTMTLRRVS